MYQPNLQCVALAVPEIIAIAVNFRGGVPNPQFWGRGGRFMGGKRHRGATPKFLGGPNPSLHLSPSSPFTFSSPSPIYLHPLRRRPFK